jgi:Fur family transcriptional regulator, ferric uptake regulator
MTPDAAEEILSSLRERDVRITSARHAIIAVLVNSDGHITADDIAASVQRQSPDIHLSTVYRTLESLEELGVIDHVHLGHGSAVYHLAENRHQHLVCERCQQVIHLPDGMLDELARTVDERYGFALRAHHSALVGLCEACRNE